MTLKIRNKQMQVLEDSMNDDSDRIDQEKFEPKRFGPSGNQTSDATSHNTFPEQTSHYVQEAGQEVSESKPSDPKPADADEEAPNPTSESNSESDKDSAKPNKNAAVATCQCCFYRENI